MMLFCDLLGLKPFRVLIRSSDVAEEAAMSVEAARRIKRGRPDLYLTILVIANLADCWRNVPEVDEIVEIKECTGVFEVRSRRLLSFSRIAPQYFSATN